MIRISDHDRVAIARLQQRHRAYEAPVPIFSMLREEGWRIERATDIWPLWGWTIEGDDSPWITINAELSIPMQRAVLAHEAAHILSSDDGESPFDRHQDSILQDWFFRHTEFRAWVAASYLMIPEGTRQRPNISRFAQVAEIPDWLIALRWPTDANLHLYSMSVFNVGLWKPLPSL